MRVDTGKRELTYEEKTINTEERIILHECWKVMRINAERQVITKWGKKNRFSTAKQWRHPDA